MDNLEIREFQQAIMDFTNKSDLPVEVKRLCFEEMLIKLREEANQQLLIEIKQRDICEKATADRKDGGNGQTVHEN